MAKDMRGSENRRGHSSAQPGETARTSGAFKNVDEIGSRSPEEIRQLLRKRALVLAEEEHPKADSSNIELLEFVLDGGSYAVESAWVDRIALVENLTHLPCAPIFIRGVINLRGEILPVVDLMEFFELRDRKAVNFRSLIVLHSGKMRFGILVHEVSGMRDVAVTDIHPSTDVLAHRGRDYLKGITTDRLAILDAERLLRDKSLVIDEYVNG